MLLHTSGLTLVLYSSQPAFYHTRYGFHVFTSGINEPMIRHFAQSLDAVSCLGQYYALYERGCHDSGRLGLRYTHCAVFAERWSFVENVLEN